MYRKSRRVRRLVAWAIMAGLVAGCTRWKTQDIAPEQVIAEKKPKLIRVTRADYSVVLLEAPHIVADSLIGMARAEGNQALRLRRRVALPLEEIRMIEVHEIDGGRTALLVAGIGLTVIAVVAAATKDDPPPPPSDHVSCPLVYSWDGEDWLLDSGTFGGAITRAAARTDVDNLVFAKAEDGILRLKLTNELNETDYVDRLRVLAVDHDPDVTVAPDGEGRIHTLGTLTLPRSARDFRGRDATARVNAADGWSWESVPTQRDTSELADIRDGLELEFSRPPAAREARLVVDAHNTPWAAYMLVEFVRAHGSATQAWYDSLDAQPEKVRQLGTMMAREAFLGVYVWASGRWEHQGVIWEAGPEVVKRQVHTLDLSRVEGEIVRVRLESAPSFWLIDQVALDYSSVRPVTVYGLDPESALDESGRNVQDLISTADDLYYVMERGDQAELRFRVPVVPEGKARSYLVRSTGWYRVHTPEVGEPDLALLGRLTAEPNGASRISVARLNDALQAMERAAR